MQANEYQGCALRTARTNETSPDDLLLNGVMGLCGESGECIDIVKKCFFQGHPIDIPHLAEELGDVAWYIAVAAYAIGYTLDDVLELNVAKLQRRYPDGFDSERSVKRGA